MKVGIIAANNIRYSPYIFYYKNILDELGVSYDLILPNRSNVEDDFDHPVHILKWNRNLPAAFSYLFYSSSVKKIVEREKYDLLIVLTMNNAVYLARWLKKKYLQKYILDIRDYTHENLSWYYYLEKIAVNNSLLNVISSKKFTAFLPSGKYLTCHNISSFRIPSVPNLNRNTPITISYIGKGGYLDNCVKICEEVSKDNRFRFEFYGLECVPDELKKFEECANISFNGVFMPKDKESILLKSDILFNVYGNGTPLLDYALSNKLYDSFMYRKPILTSPHTYMSEIAGPFAFDVDICSPISLDKLFQWYSKLDFSILDKYAITKLSEIKEESERTINFIKESIRNGIG